MIPMTELELVPLRRCNSDKNKGAGYGAPRRSLATHLLHYCRRS